MIAHHLPKTTENAGWGPLLVHTVATRLHDDVLPASPRAARCQTTERNRMSGTRLIAKWHAHAFKAGEDNRPDSWSMAVGPCIVRVGSAFSRGRSISRTGHGARERPIVARVPSSARAPFPARMPSVTREATCISTTSSSPPAHTSPMIARTASAVMATEFQGMWV